MEGKQRTAVTWNFRQSQHVDSETGLKNSQGERVPCAFANGAARCHSKHGFAVDLGFLIPECRFRGTGKVVRLWVCLMKLFLCNLTTVLVF